MVAVNSLDRAVQSLTADFEVCVQHAKWCTNQAEIAVNKKIREDFLSLAQRWLKLAGGYERSLRSHTRTGKQGHSFLE